MEKTNKPFKKVSDFYRKDKVIRVRVNDVDHFKIKVSAQNRNMNVSEFMRRAGLGRKADVRYEHNIILELRQIIREIRCLKTTVAETGAFLPEEQWLLIVENVVEVMLRIEK